jgi:hypothetical protein
LPTIFSLEMFFFSFLLYIQTTIAVYIVVPWKLHHSISVWLYSLCTESQHRHPTECSVGKYFATVFLRYLVWDIIINLIPKKLNHTCIN